MIHEQESATIGTTLLANRSEYLQERSSESHLSLLIHSDEKRNVNKE